MPSNICYERGVDLQVDMMNPKKVTASKITTLGRISIMFEMNKTH